MRLACIYIYTLLSIAFLPFEATAQSSSKDYKKYYATAEKLANATNHTSKTDQQALQYYFKSVQILAGAKSDNVFLLKAYITTGAFLQVLDRPKDAITYFSKAFVLKRSLPGIKDSVLFKPLVYCGNSYYHLDKIDSASAYYKKAENIAEAYPQVSEQERLYNTLGVIAYATGNYNKSITYYEKAIVTLGKHPGSDNLLLITYKNNLALAYRKLSRYEDALKIYGQLITFHVETDKLLHNIGSVYLAMGQSGKAIEYLKKVKYVDQKKLNDLGRAYLEQHDNNNALLLLNQATALNTKLNGTRKNSDQGITLKYMGDLWLQQKQPAKALTLYQQAINNLQFDFHSGNIYTNPTDFNSVFNNVELLETLVAKGQAFNLLYLQQHSIKDLDASLQTYLAFYKLADHIERFYENDDARLLISDRKYASHHQPIDICLELYKLTKNKKYIEKAFLLDEENKANTLSLNLRENEMKAHSRIPANLLNQETSLKENVTRNVLQASGLTDSTALNIIKQRVNDYTIRLIKVQQKINAQTGLSSRNFSSGDISIPKLQKVIPKSTAILSYHIGDTSLLCFIITADKFDFFINPLQKNFYPLLKQIYKQGQYRDGSNSRQLKANGQQLYRQLIEPAENFLQGTRSLMIIPDDELNYLPFEILQDENGENLLEKYTVTYNYSCTILQNSRGAGSSIGTGVLAMAPFDQASNSENWPRLPASRQEIAGLQGTQLYNTQATKQAFITKAQNFNIVHLATHAYANDRDPNQSFIAFYPGTADPPLKYKLYIPEIYNLKFDKTRLVILSACESGTGELVKGEGLMSLSRAFSYAGCNSIITSMWKADDASTAYISARLHHYIKNKYTIAAALQQARLDYLDNDTISPAKKMPGYWAHLRLTGNFEEEHKTGYWFAVIIAIVLGTAFFAIKNRDRFNGPGT